MSQQVVLLLLSLFVTGNAIADWKVLDRDEHGTSYIDLSTQRVTDTGYSVWTLYDAEVPLRVRPTEWSHSTRVWHEFNCQKKEARTLVMVKYESRMASGHVLEVVSSVSEWSAVSPSTGRNEILRQLCR